MCEDVPITAHTGLGEQVGRCRSRIGQVTSSRLNFGLVRGVGPDAWSLAGPGVVVDDPGEQVDQLPALLGGQRSQQLVLHLAQQPIEVVELPPAGRRDTHDVAAPVGRIRGALDQTLLD